LPAGLKQLCLICSLELLQNNVKTFLIHALTTAPAASPLAENIVCEDYAQDRILQGRAEVVALLDAFFIRGFAKRARCSSLFFTGITWLPSWASLPPIGPSSWASLMPTAAAFGERS
jgi:hypothetical protein